MTNTASPNTIPTQQKDLILITGSSGLIGNSLAKKLASRYRVVGLDKVAPPHATAELETIVFDITDQASIRAALERVRYGYGDRIASVIHLAAYYSFDSKDSPAYDTINVEGTRHFLEELHRFEVEQLIFSSSDLIYKPSEPGVKIHEDCPVAPNWGYPESKVQTEALIREQNREIPVVFLRLAGIYNEDGHSIPISQQIKRIYEKDLLSHFYSGDVDHGDVFVHMDDALDAFVRTVERRGKLPHEIAINIGEPETPTYEQLQDAIGKHLHGKEWETYEVPKPLAKAGAWARTLVGDPFIKPWMIDRAGEHYELDITRAKELLGWEPRHRLIQTLPDIIANLKEDPGAWYEVNHLNT